MRHVGLSSRGQKRWELDLQAYYAVNQELSVYSA